MLQTVIGRGGPKAGLVPTFFWTLQQNCMQAEMGPEQAGGPGHLQQEDAGGGGSEQARDEGGMGEDGVNGESAFSKRSASLWTPEEKDSFMQCFKVCHCATFPAALSCLSCWFNPLDSVGSLIGKISVWCF